MVVGGRAEHPHAAHPSRGRPTCQPGASPGALPHVVDPRARRPAPPQRPHRSTRRACLRDGRVWQRRHARRASTARAAPASRPSSDRFQIATGYHMEFMSASEEIPVALGRAGVLHTARTELGRCREQSPNGTLPNSAEAHGPSVGSDTPRPRFRSDSIESRSGRSGMGRLPPPRHSRPPHGTRRAGRSS